MTQSCKTLLLAAFAIALAVAPRPVGAQSYPSRAIHFINPFPAGGPSDTVARIYAQRMAQDWNQSVVVENRVGATGTIGTEAVVRSPPDGYTLAFTVDLPITMAPALMSMHYDPRRDLIPVAAVASAENVMSVKASAGIHSLAELVAAAKAQPGVLTFASAGNGSPGHLCGEMIKARAGIDMIHVPFTGAAPAMNAVLAGNVTMFCGPIEVTLPHIKAGTVVGVGVTGTKPSPLLPDVAPLSATYPGLVIANWFGLLAPAGTPPAVTAALESEFKKISDDAELQQRLTQMGLDPQWLSSAGLARRIEADTVKWHDFVESAHIRSN